MRVNAMPLAATIALGLATAACESPSPTACGASPAPSRPSVGVSAF